MMDPRLVCAVLAPITKVDRVDDVHVYPTFGKPHDVSRACWCVPLSERRDARVVVHRVMS